MKTTITITLPGSKLTPRTLAIALEESADQNNQGHLTFKDGDSMDLMFCNKEIGWIEAKVED